MAFENLAVRLGEDEFAFYFSGGAGVSAEDLGSLLSRAATVARRADAQLQVTALEPGSLAVVIRILKKSGAAVGNEFKASPVQTTAAAATLLSIVVGALVHTMSPDGGDAKPLAAVAAEIVEKGDAEKIEIITRKSTILVMDSQRALRVNENNSRKKHRLLEASIVRGLMESARIGELTGTVIEVEGALHFRPDGFRYLVPIDMSESQEAWRLYPGLHLRVAADFSTLYGQPDSIEIHRAEPI